MKRRRPGDKTVIHWKNISKACVFLLIAGVFVSFVPITGIANFVFGIFSGGFSMLLCVKYLNLWHFESK